MAYADRHIWTSAEFDTDGGGDDPLAFSPINRIQIHKIGLVVTNSDDGDVSALFEDRTAASTDAPIETVAITAGTAGSNQGKLFYTELATPYVLLPGHRLNVASTAGGGSEPTVFAVVEYSLLDMDLDNATLAVESA